MQRELHTLRSLQVPLLPLIPHGKRPRLKRWQDRVSPDMPIRPDENYGVCDPRIAFIDLDTPELADWWNRNMPDSPWKVWTPSGGMHAAYAGTADMRNAQRAGRGWDIRAGGKGFVVGPGSEVNGRLYRLFGEITLELPPADPGWWPRKVEPVEKPKTIIPSDIAGVRRLTRARAYAGRVRCVAGQRAHDTFYRLLCWIRDVPGCTRDEAESVIDEWNRTNCFDENGHPWPWTPREIDHKLSEVFK